MSAPKQDDESNCKSDVTKSINYFNSAKLLAGLKQYNDAMQYYFKALDSANEQLESQIFLRIASLLNKNGYISYAIKCHLQHLKIVKDKGILCQQVKAFNYLSYLYGVQQNWQEALRCAEKQLALSRMVYDVDSENDAKCLINDIRETLGLKPLSELELTSKSLDKKSSIEIEIKSKIDIREQWLDNHRQAMEYFDSNNFELAADHHEINLNFARNFTKLKVDEETSSINLGISLMKMEMYDQAIHYFENILECGGRENQRLNEKRAVSKLEIIYCEKLLNVKSLFNDENNIEMDFRKSAVIMGKLDSKVLKYSDYAKRYSKIRRSLDTLYVAQQGDFRKLIMDAHIAIGDDYFLLEFYKNSKDHYHEALIIANEFNRQGAIIFPVEYLLYNVYICLGDREAALKILHDNRRLERIIHHRRLQRLARANLSESLINRLRWKSLLHFREQNYHNTQAEKRIKLLQDLKTLSDRVYRLCQNKMELYLMTGEIYKEEEIETDDDKIETTI